jgi:hypothetical protein
VLFQAVSHGFGEIDKKALTSYCLYRNINLLKTYDTKPELFCPEKERSAIGIVPKGAAIPEGRQWKKMAFMSASGMGSISPV